jgi:hypothetical protein
VYRNVKLRITATTGPPIFTSEATESPFLVDTLAEALETLAVHQHQEIVKQQEQSSGQRYGPTGTTVNMVYLPVNTSLLMIVNQDNTAFSGTNFDFAEATGQGYRSAGTTVNMVYLPVNTSLLILV